MWILQTDQPFTNRQQTRKRYFFPASKSQTWGTSEHGAQAIRRLAVMMPTISQEEVGLIADEWNVYIAGAVDTDDTDCAEERVNHYWANVFQEKSHQGKFKYSILQRLVKSLLSLAHGNADVERSLSANKKTATPDRASLSL